MTRATCPTCGQSVATLDRRLVPHYAVDARRSAGRWVRDVCRGSGHTQPAPSGAMHETEDAK